MRTDKRKAISLRKEGKSYNQISSLLAIPKSTLSGWFGREDWSENIKQRLIASVQEVHTIRLTELNIVRGQRLAEAYECAKSEAVQEFKILKYNPLFIAAMMLYWGEGDKRSKAVRLTNTDAKMICLYVFFLKTVCQIPEKRIRVNILVYPDLDIETCLTYWSKESGLSKENFIKCTPIVGRHKTQRLEHGICIVLVSSAYLKTKFLTWLELIPNILMNREYYENM